MTTSRTARRLHLSYVATMVPADVVMARSHLLGLKRRAERAGRRPPVGRWRATAA